MASIEIIIGPEVDYRRVTLTKAQAEGPTGQALIAAIFKIAEDGVVTEEEARGLRALLDELDGTGTPAVDFLFDTIDDVLSDGIYSVADAFELRAALARVLPKALRDRAFGRRKSTPPQRAYLERFGIHLAPDSSLDEADDLIEKAHDENPLAPTNRQVMVLRFWDKMEVAQRGRRGVSAWMSGWYRDPRKRPSWELYKLESGIGPGQGDPGKVPIGIGWTYLERISMPLVSDAADGIAAALAQEDE